MEKYKISGIYYSKPKIIRDSHGEPSYARYGVWIDVGQPSEFNGVGAKKVSSIAFDGDLNSFKVYFEKGGLKVVPMQFDTEVTYEEIKDDAKIKK